MSRHCNICCGHDLGRLSNHGCKLPSAAASPQHMQLVDGVPCGFKVPATLQNQCRSRGWLHSGPNSISILGPPDIQRTENAWLWAEFGS